MHLVGFITKKCDSYVASVVDEYRVLVEWCWQEKTDFNINTTAKSRLYVVMYTLFDRKRNKRFGWICCLRLQGLSCRWRQEVRQIRKPVNQTARCHIAVNSYLHTRWNHKIRKQTSAIQFCNCKALTSMYHVQYALTFPHTSAPAILLPEDDEVFKCCIFQHRVTGDFKTLG